MYNSRFTIKKTVSECCEAGSYFIRSMMDNGDFRPYAESFRCDNCGEFCERKTLIYMTHKNVGKGTYRELPEPVLVSDFIFANL